MLEDLCLMSSSYVLGQACCPSQSQVMAINWLSLIRPYIIHLFIWMYLNVFALLHQSSFHKNAHESCLYSSSNLHHSYSSANQQRSGCATDSEIFASDQSIMAWSISNFSVFTEFGKFEFFAPNLLPHLWSSHQNYQW